MVVMVAQHVNILNATELHTLKLFKWSTLCYAYFTTILKNNF